MARGEVHADTSSVEQGKEKAVTLFCQGLTHHPKNVMQLQEGCWAETEEKESTYRKTIWKKSNMTSKTIKKKEKETISLYETNFLSFWYTKTKQTKPEYSMTSEDGIIIIISCDEFIYPKSKT